VIESPLKRFLATWVLPPGVAAAWRNRRIPPLQKFWRGAPLPVPPRERALFDAAGLASSTITRQDDTRSCARVETRASLPLPDGAAGESVQFAVTAAHRTPGSIRAGAGGAAVSQAGLSADEWLDIRMDVPQDATSLQLESDVPAFISFPRAVRVRSDAPGRIRHVIVLVLDGWTTRVSAERHPTEPATPLTPNIDRFFANGFEAPLGYSTAEWTMPTAASFFTGLYPSRHRTFHPYAASALPADRELLAERFQRAGYHTLCMSVANRLTPAYGHHRGFDRFVYHFPEPGFTLRRYDPAGWLSDLTGHLDAHRRDRTFSYVHLPDVHPVWEIPPFTRSFNLARRGDSVGLDLLALRKSPNADEQGRQLYLLRLHDLDRLLGGVFDFIDRHLADETIVLLTADHGTPWHHVRAHRPSDEPNLVDDRTAISLRLRGPGVPHRRYEGLVAPNLDLLPTLFGLAGFDAPPDLDGENLLEPRGGRDILIAESLYRGVYEVAARDGRRVFIEKYPLDEKAVAVGGPATYAKLFAAGASDYARVLDDDPGVLRAAIRAHLAHCGLEAAHA
jgi:hypothetical protein